MGEQTYQPKILLVEDQKEFHGPVTRWLHDTGYTVRLATSYDEAKSALESEHFHLAIIDIRLVDGDQKNHQGFQLLEIVEQLGLKDIMPCIILSAHATSENIMRAWMELDAARFIKKEPRYRRKLMQCVQELFSREVQINFDLTYVGGSEEVLSQVARDINWSMAEKPISNLLTPQVRDLFGKLFIGARSLYISKLKPGLTGAAIVRIQPTWTGGLGRSYVAKLGRRDKVETEQQRYDLNVKRYLPANTVAQVGTAYTRQLGALQYTFAETERRPLVEFDEYYDKHIADQIITSLKNLFQHTCRFWYDGRERNIEDLPSLYFDAFQLDHMKLIGRIQMVLPQFDPDADMMQLSPESAPVVNPLAWLRQNQAETVFPVYRCITHGDLTGRNMMVDDIGKCWLIDFYRTYESHILRDFVILETDIKYRLLPTVNLPQFLQMEAALCTAEEKDQPSRLGAEMSAGLQKTTAVLTALRYMAHDYARGLHSSQTEVHQEYLISLLMATLNVVRLRHVNETRKFQALHSAVLICAELDKLAGRDVETMPFSAHLKPALSLNDQHEDDSGFFTLTATKTTAQQRFLAENILAGNVLLFIGSEPPPGANWPNNNDLAQKLMKEVDYTPTYRDSPRKLFAFYLNRTGDRTQLVNEHLLYFDGAERPSFFSKAANLPWYTIYTTNQHTYLEEAFSQRQIPFAAATAANGLGNGRAQHPHIFKLNGSLNDAHRHDPPSELPLTEYDYRERATAVRLQQLWQNIGANVSAGKYLLMLCASEEELALAHESYQASGVNSEGLIWVTGSNMAEEEQDVYRNLGFRVLPERPEMLLRILATLVK
ncbi:MAG: response regulator [Chloroflexi bacterium]|nr:response regulator [Chloroflexota bacterium]